MKTRLEKDVLRYTYLEAFERGYTTGDFSEVFPYLAEDCVMESQWVLIPGQGYQAVVNYLIGKGETLKRTDSFPGCSIVELIGGTKLIKGTDSHINEERQYGSLGPLYTSGEICLLMEQIIDDKTNGVMLCIKLSDEDQIARIDLYDPALFCYRHYDDYLTFYPVNRGELIREGKMHVSSAYYTEFHLFLGMVGEFFDEYDDCLIPMDKWISSLEKWKKSFAFPSFDQAFEDACGIDYQIFSAKDEQALRTLSNSGKKLWNNRHVNMHMHAALTEWTEKYRAICDGVEGHGY